MTVRDGERLGIFTTTDLRDALLRDLGEMRDLITDLLESERLATGHAALQTERVDLGALARELLATQFAQAAVTLRFDETLGPVQAVELGQGAALVPHLPALAPVRSRQNRRPPPVMCRCCRPAFGMWQCAGRGSPGKLAFLW